MGGWGHGSGAHIVSIVQQYRCTVCTVQCITHNAIIDKKIMVIVALVLSYSHNIKYIQEKQHAISFSL